ncbi:UTRA domain-containing protein [Pseudoroseomonas wenyumeiae]|uniref:GntR family transcriptional regulator n=2 Tax=Acetobacterales TaxID=3120395 RepID=A0A3A9JM95_9PROT|nr:MULTISPECIES: GntR family transcriptional regulator [Pseudoroseomonas]MBC9176063.1 GntR family transcriptional regulator [Pseudoroseomonas ludipueritiae]RKK04854.1 GntR family transcriptional regulator [Pseudoroseomonas wenyumeiae]RMI20511.1 UTRA domain-containing protein [Pseudoroseomonas wenyumeiae]
MDPITTRPSGGATTTGKVDLSRSAVSRYIQLATLFRRRIEQGTWKLGQQIPTVDDLAAECGVARATIRQALGQLEQEGLIERYRAKGTFVRKGPESPIWCAVETDWNGLLRSREGAEIEILGEEGDVPGSTLPDTIGEPAPAYRHIRRRHWRDGRPFLLADVYLDERLAPLVTPEDLRSKTALRLVAGLEGVKIVDARQTLTIGTADVETAAALQVPLNAPVALVHRAAVDANGVLVLVADGIYRGDTVRIDIKLK